MTPFAPPHIGDAVKRPRLFALLDRHRHRQNVIITGQAAQGKSTLMASYLDARPEQVLWFHMDKAHADHAKLFDLFLEGLDSLFPPLHQPLRPPRPQLGTGQALLRHIQGLTTLLRSAPAPLFIVMDDFESIGESSTGFELVKGILSDQFSGIRFFILSRTVPPLPVDRFKLEQQTVLLTNEMLAFTLDETRLFFAGKQAVTPDEIIKIQTLTHGWAGGLALLSQPTASFRQLGDTPQGLSGEMFLFFSREIYQALPPEIRNFLMVTSVLDIIDIEAATHLSATADARTTLEILQDLEKRNLFIQRTNTGTAWPEFRYHGIFREFLLQDLTHRQGSASLEGLHRQAGGFYRDRGDHAQAMAHLIRAMAHDEMAQIIKKKGTAYIIQQKTSQLKSWITHLPPAMVEEDPWLLFYSIMTRRIQGGKKNIRDLKQALALFEADADIRGMLLAMGFLIEAAVFVRQPSRRIRHFIDKSEKLLRELPHKNRFAWARALLWQQMGLGCIAGDGNIPRGISACKNAILLGRRIHNHDLVLNASITLTFGHVQAGDFAGARRMLAHMEQMTSEGGHPEYRALKNMVAIDFALKNGQFHRAKTYLEESEKDIEKFGLIFLYPGFVEARALHLAYTGRYGHARQMADHLNDFSILEGNDFYKGISHRIKALSYLKAGMPRPAAREIENALKELDQVRKGDIHYHLTRQLAGTIAFHNQEFDKARRILDPALDYFQEISSDLSFCETSMVLGLMHWESGEVDMACHHLKNSLEMGARENYRYFPLMHASMPVKAVLILATLGKITASAPYAAMLLENCDFSQLTSQMMAILNHGAPRPSEKSRRIQCLLPFYKKKLAPLRINTLGRFILYSGNTVMDTQTFGGSKPVLLLKAILRHGARDIPREVLIDDLWPDAGPSAGEKNLKINLHRLRKGLEPSPLKVFGYTYVQQKSGRISLDPDLVSLDVDEFMALGRRAMAARKENQPEAALSLYEAATRLYQGDYFAEEPYMEWISRKRDLFRSRFMNLMQEKALLHEELDQMDRAVETWYRLLGMDPCFEPAYRNLMILYADTGKKNKALDLFKQCRRTLEKELATAPEGQTMDLYHQICSR